MKKFLFALALGALTTGLAGTSFAGGCAGNNSKACRDARAAFAEHHNGQYPQQYYNQWYNGRQGRWNRENQNWRWEGMNGEDYAHNHNKWEWQHRHHEAWW